MIDLEEYRGIRTVDKSIEKLLSSLPRKLKNNTSTALIHKAIKYASSAHSGQVRRSGEPYIVHPILVSSIVAYVSYDLDMILTALLHDVVEDTEKTLEDITEEFGENVANMVDALTKIASIKEEQALKSKKDYEEKPIFSAVNLRKLFLQTNYNEKIFIVKLCDRLHNLMTLDALKPEKQVKISQESLIVYAPIAHRLGISFIKNFIEDISFSYISPEAHKSILDYTQEHRHPKSLSKFITNIKKNLLNENMESKEFKIMSRIKHAYSTHIKMLKQGIPVSEVLDILALRVIVNTRQDCYRVLGVIHSHYKPIIPKFKDYISLPKENGYQTIHTTVLTEYGTYEIQIRTKDMHKSAEYGIAAHWRYKGLDTAMPNIQWFKNLEYKNVEIKEFQDMVTHDLYTETVEVFSPKNKVFSLPRGSVVLDFAYAVHTRVGDYAKKATVNKKPVSLLRELQSGDIVRIHTDDEVQYHCSWFDMVQTSKAKKQIRHLCSGRLKQKDIQNAYNILTTFFEKPESVIVERLEQRPDLLKNINHASHDIHILKNTITSLQDMMPSEGLFSRRIRLSDLKPITVDEFIFYHKKALKETIVSHCCRPKMGDNIVGLIYRSRLIIHHKMCHEASKKIQNHTASVFVQWDSQNLNQFILKVNLADRVGALSELLQLLAKFQANITTIKIDEKQNTGEHKENCTIHFTSRSEKSKVQIRLLDRKYKIVSLETVDYQQKIY